MGEIKSAWEIAREKADKLGELSSEERKMQMEGRCKLIGESLAEKYLSGGSTRSLEAELNKYGSEEKELITRVVVQRLIEEIDLKHGSVLDKISQGILNLIKIESAAETVDKIAVLLQDYQATEYRERQEIEKAGRAILHQMEISGTAVDTINIRAKDEWQKKLDQLIQPFEERLNRLKQELSS